MSNWTDSLLVHCWLTIHFIRKMILADINEEDKLSFISVKNNKSLSDSEYCCLTRAQNEIESAWKAGKTFLASEMKKTDKDKADSYYYYWNIWNGSHVLQKIKKI